MSNSVLLDTSFLISLVDDSRTNHCKAKDFYKYFIDNKIAMILSSIVTSEFCIKQPITDLPLINFKPLSFNIHDSYHLRDLFESNFKSYSDNVSRISIKDDYKIVSQCNFNKITYLITEDQELYLLLQELYKAKQIRFQGVYLPNGYEVSFGLQTKLF